MGCSTTRLLGCFFLLGLASVQTALSEATKDNGNENDFECEDGYRQMGHDCYGVADIPANFAAAERYCMDDGGHLASIHSEEEADFLYNWVDTNNKYIGLRNINGDFVWTDGSPVDYTEFDAEVRPGDCYTLDWDCWSITSCDRLYHATGFVCKKPAFQKVPSGCPSTSVYYDRGELYSPGYPFNSTSGGGPLKCKYQLAARNEYYIVAAINIYWTDVDPLPTVRVYEGWTMDDSKLLRSFNGSTTRLLAVSKTNRMLIVFEAKIKGKFDAVWYSNKVVQSSQPNGLHASVAGALQSNSNFQHCPKNNIFNDDSQIDSPNSPLGFPPNLDCHYYIKRLNATYSSKAWVFGLPRLSLGAEDFIELIDLRSNTTFASTKDFLGQRIKWLVVPFDFAVHFHSGGDYDPSHSWQFFFGFGP